MIKALAKKEDHKFILGKTKIRIVEELKASYYLKGEFLIKENKDYYINYKEEVIYIKLKNKFSNLAFALIDQFDLSKSSHGTIENILKLQPSEVLYEYLNSIGMDTSIIDYEKIDKEQQLEEEPLKEDPIEQESIEEEFKELNKTDNLIENNFDDNDVTDDQVMENKKIKEINEGYNPQNRIKKHDIIHHNLDQNNKNNRKISENARIKGLEAQEWLYQKIKMKLKDYPNTKIEPNVRDNERKETDILITHNNFEYHIEVKRINSGSIYWSELEFKKCLEYKTNYFMVLLKEVEDDELNYNIFWIWKPNEDLLILKDRKIIWRWEAKEETSSTLPFGNWYFDEITYPELKGKLHYLIKINEDFLNAKSDKDNYLDILVGKIKVKNDGS